MESKQKVLEGFLLKANFFGVGSLVKVIMYKNGEIDYYNQSKTAKMTFPAKTATYTIKSYSSVDLDKKYLTLQKVLDKNNKKNQVFFK